MRPGGVELGSVKAFESLTLLVRFLLELCLLAALGYWGFETGDSAVAQWLLGLGAPVAAAVASTALAVLFVIVVVLHGAAMAALGLRGAPRP